MTNEEREELERLQLEQLRYEKELREEILREEERQRMGKQIENNMLGMALAIIAIIFAVLMVGFMIYNKIIDLI